MHSRHSLRLQPLKRTFDRQIRRYQSSKRKDDDPEPHIPRFIHRKQRTMPILNHIQQQRPWRQISDRPTRFVFALEPFQQTDIGTEISSGAQADETFVVTVLLVRVGSGNQDDVGACFVFGCFGGFDAGEVDFAGDYLFSG